MQTKLHEQSHIGITLRKTTWCSNHTLYPVLYRTHWAEFHALFGSVNTDYLEFKRNAWQSPHILHCFFTERTEAFVKHWLYNILRAEWLWYRFEYASIRGAIHCHGLAKLKK